MSLKTQNAEKILVSIIEIFEASITTLENTMDLSKLTLEELLNSLDGQHKEGL